MPISFPQTVNPPGGVSFAPPLMSFSGFSNWRPDDPYAQQFKDQQKRLNDFKLQQAQQQSDLSQAFSGGLPIDPSTGQVDYRKAASILAQKGDINGAMTLLQQQPAPLSPLLGGQPQGGAPGQGGGQPPSAMAPPGSVASQPLPPVTDTAAKIMQAESGGDPNAKNPNSSAAGLGGFTDQTWIESVKRYFPNLAQGRSDDQILSMRRIPQLAARVTEAFTAGNMDGLQKAGLPATPATTYLAHFAGLGGAIKVLRADPNTPVSQILSADAIKANPFLKNMTARDLEVWASNKMAGPSMVAQRGQPQSGAPADDTAFSGRFAGETPRAAPNVRVADAFGMLPPSVAAVSPAPQQNAPASPQEGQGAPQPQPAPQQPVAAPAAPQASPAAQQPAQQPLVPMPALPQGYTDPQKAINDLRLAAAREAADPRPGAAQQAQAMNAWADRIEAATRPIPMRPGETLLNPQTWQPVYQGNQPTLSPQAVQDAAERYLQTGQFPPNMGRGMQGNADRNAILDEANRLATDRGIDTATLPQKWQQFKAQQIAVQRFTSGKQGDTIRSFNVLVDHLDTLSEAASALKNGDIRLFNRWKQNWAAQTGETAPTNFDGVKALVGDEIVKAVVGGAGALADREEVKKDLDRASSPKQLAELVEKYKKLALGQLHGLQKQYETSTGLKNFGDMLLPGTLKALGGPETAKPDADGWISMPNGVRVREVK